MATAAAPSSASATPRDLVRQIVVISAFSFMIIGDAVGIGAFGGTPIQDAVGGAFDPDASYLTPATSAFSIWSLIYLVRTRQPQDRIVATALLDGATGLHLGWATLATVANVAAALTATGPASWGDAADVVGVVMIVVVVIALVLAAWSRWSLAPGLAIGWGLVWLAVARLGGDLHSTPIGVAAIGAAGIVVLVPAGMRVLRQFRPVD